MQPSLSAKALYQASKFTAPRPVEERKRTLKRLMRIRVEADPWLVQLATNFIWVIEGCKSIRNTETSLG